MGGEIRALDDYNISAGSVASEVETSTLLCSFKRAHSFFVKKRDGKKVGVTATVTTRRWRRWSSKAQSG